MKARLARREDFPAVWGLATRFHAEAFADLELDAAKAMTALAAAVEAMTVLVATDGDVVGALALRDGSPWYSDRRVLSDLMFYVAPEARGRGAAIALLRAATAFAAAEAVPLLVSVSSGLKPDRQDKLFARVGFRRIGGLYRMG